MSEKRIIWLRDAATRQRALDAIREAPDGWKVTLQPPTRTLDQNAALWPILNAFSNQKQWSINGKPARLTPSEWKDVLSASFQNERLAMAPMVSHIGVVMLGLRTSKMNKRQFSEFLEFVNSIAVEFGIDLLDASND